MSKRILNILLLFLVFSLTFQLIFGPQNTTPVDPNAKITFQTKKSDYSFGQTVELNITNHTAEPIKFVSECPDEQFTVLYTTPADPIQKTHTSEVNCEKSTDIASKDFIVMPGQSRIYPYSLWSNSLFNELGRYKIVAEFTLNNETVKVQSNEFEITRRGFFGQIWIGLFYQPIFNLLVALIQYLPGHSLGFAIIILTLIIRSLLFVPSQKAMKSQRKLADIQPKIAHIREKYKDNQQKLAEETMKIWKEHKVNPMGSCLPLIIQFPILIGLFYVIQRGLNPDNSYLLYNFVSNFDFTNIQTNFLNILELTTQNVWVLPLIVGGLQFIQMKLALTKKKDADNNTNNQAQAVQNVMMYFMPVMIAVFTASLPAGVGLYWGTSTLFGIGQQIYVNKTTN